jgi:acyl carrier protein
LTDRDELRDRIRAIFVEKLHINPPTDGTNLLEAGLLDSLALVDLLFHLEQDLGTTIAIQDLELEDLGSIDRIAALVAARRDGA